MKQVALIAALLCLAGSILNAFAYADFNRSANGLMAFGGLFGACASFWQWRNWK